MPIRALARRVGAIIRANLGLASRAEASDDIGRAIVRHERWLKERLGRMDKEQRRISRLLQQVVLEQSEQARHLQRMESDVAALLRRDALQPERLPFPQSLLSQRFRSLSQNDEDGITLALFDLIGHGSRRFAEIGAGTNGGNSGFLARECGWTGLMVDASSERVKRLQRNFGPHGVATVAEMVSRENVNALLESHGLTGEIDLLSVDIDGNDYWVWQALTVVSPRVVIVEYNAAWGAEQAVVVPYHPTFDRHAHDGPLKYYGASLEAFIRLAAEKGYRFLTTEPRGVNAYFVRNDIDLPADSRAHRGIPLDGQEPPLVRLVRERGLPLVHLG